MKQKKGLRVRRVSLALELEEIAQLLESAHSSLAIGHLPNGEIAHRTPQLVEALVGVVLRRLRQVALVASGQLAASAIWTTINDTTAV